MATSTKTLRESRVLNPTILTLIAILVGWQIVSMFFHPRDFPGLIQLVENLYEVFFAGRFDFVENVTITLTRIAIGFLIAMLLGTFVGILMGNYVSAEEYLTTPVMAFLTFPAVVWAFMAIMWWGITTYQVHIFVIAAGVTPYVIVNTWKGAEAVDHDLIDMADAFEASTYLQWRHIHIPNLKPFLYSSARIAFAISWKISLIAEVFGATSGVGYIVNIYFETLRADMIVAWAIPVMLLMYAIERGLKRLEERSFAWRPELEDEHEQVTGE